MPADAAPRIPPLDPPYAPEVAANLARRMPENSPVPPLALFRVLARHPGLAAAMEPLGAFNLNRKLMSAGTGPSLAPRDREIVIDRICALCRCEYEWGVHVASYAKRVGLSDVQVEATVAPRTDQAAWDERDRLLVRLADALHERADVSDDLWAALAAGWSEAQLLELLVLAGFYHAICFVANAARVPLEPWAARFPAAGAAHA